MVACLFAHNVEWVVHRESHDTTDYQDVQKKREREEDENNNNNIYIYIYYNNNNK